MPFPAVLRKQLQRKSIICSSDAYTVVVPAQYRFQWFTHLNVYSSKYQHPILEDDYSYFLNDSVYLVNQLYGWRMRLFIWGKYATFNNNIDNVAAQSFSWDVRAKSFRSTKNRTCEVINTFYFHDINCWLDIYNNRCLFAHIELNETRRSDEEL